MNSLFISHGGGPLPLLGDARHTQMVDVLRGLAAKLRKPDALIVVSAHWEAEVPTITSGAKPALIYDYAGFPPASYEIQYPCSGEPALAQRMSELFAAAGIRARLDEQRGLDHGVFVPLKIILDPAVGRASEWARRADWQGANRSRYRGIARICNAAGQSAVPAMACVASPPFR